MKNQFEASDALVVAIESARIKKEKCLEYIEKFKADIAEADVIKNRSILFYVKHYGESLFIKEYLAEEYARLETALRIRVYDNKLSLKEIFEFLVSFIENRVVHLANERLSKSTCLFTDLGERSKMEAHRAFLKFLSGIVLEVFQGREGFIIPEVIRKIGLLI